jgi:hypothetical protein
MPPRLTEEDFLAAAELLDCDVAAVKAVAEVESRGDGFLQDGRPRVLFEGHQFFKFTSGAYAASHPTLCHKEWTKANYCKGDAETRGRGEWDRLRQAMACDRAAAIKSCSIGKFQVMGFNYGVCGFQSVDEFWDALSRSEADQLNAFCAFVKANRLDRHLRARNWAAFARGYNGEDYAKNQYDVKLAKAYAGYAKPAMPATGPRRPSTRTPTP